MTRQDKHRLRNSKLLVVSHHHFINFRPSLNISDKSFKPLIVLSVVNSPFNMSESEYSSDEEKRQYYMKKHVMMLDIPFIHLAPRKDPLPRQRIPKSNWWVQCYPLLETRAYKSRYRMERETVESLALFLFPYSSYKTNEICLKATCVTINYLATHARQCDLMSDYNCATGYVNEYIFQIRSLILKYLEPLVTVWPDLEERKRLALETKCKYGIPFCIGATDGTYIFCKGMGATPMDYTCRKSDFSFNLVLIMDVHLKIRHYISNNVGALGDKQILDKSYFMANVFSNFKLGEDDLDNSIGLKSYFIAADKGLKSGNFIITPYDERHRVLSTQQKGSIIIYVHLEPLLKYALVCLNCGF